MNANISYIDVIESYKDSRTQIRQLLSSILDTIIDPNLLNSSDYRQLTLKNLSKAYPYADMLYTLSPDGIQIGNNAVILKSKKSKKLLSGENLDRRYRPYYQLAKNTDDVVVTEPYLSITDGRLVVSAARKVYDLNDENQVVGFIVCDFDVLKLISTLMGDNKRKKCVPFFNFVYSVIVAGLLLVMLMLLFKAFNEIIHFFDHFHGDSLRPFTTIIFLTLALSIFDLAKTVLEEEVLMHKNIFRHSSTRRTITRFISAILIAVSIESLLLMFKASLGSGEYIVQAVWMMLAATGLLASLGFYVYMGAKAEKILLSTKKNQN